MSFRDDDAAARARADALAEEVAQLRKERDALLAEKASAPEVAKQPTEKKRKKKGRKETTEEPGPKPTGPLGGLLPELDRYNVFWAVVVVVAVAFPIGMGVWGARKSERAHAAYREAKDRREAMRSRWGALTAVEPCSRMVTFDTIWARDAVTTGTHRKNPAMVANVFRSLTTNCLAGPKTLANDPEIPARARATLAGWLASEAKLTAPATRFAEYYGHDDWREDDHRAGEEQWKALAPLLEARDRALEELRRDGFPLLRDAMRGMVRAELAKNPGAPIGPRLEIGLLLWDVGERATARARALDDPSARDALKASALAVLAETQRAPIEVRREVRKLEAYLVPASMGSPLSLERLYNLARPSPDLLETARADVPGLPPEPTPPPDDD